MARVDAGAIERPFHHERGELDGVRRGQRAVLLSPGDRVRTAETITTSSGLSGRSVLSVISIHL
jgi:hypothetical protein